MTGASSGIGAATASTLADLGARVALGYHRNRKGAEETRARSSRQEARPIALEADVRRAEDVRRWSIAPSPISGPSIFSSTTLARSSPARDSRADRRRAQRHLALNLKSAVLASQAVAASMIERRRGAIINIVSIAGHTGGGPGAGAYASAKAALTAYTKSLARSWRRMACESTRSLPASSTHRFTRSSRRRR